jgi:hypothetical protein
MKQNIGCVEIDDLFACIYVYLQSATGVQCVAHIAIQKTNATFRQNILGYNFLILSE